MGDAFGADVININGWGAEISACGSAPQAEIKNARVENKMMDE